MLILGGLLLLLGLIVGLFSVGFLALRVLQVVSLIALVILLAAGLGALGFGSIVGVIAALVLQATLTANAPLLSIAAGLAVALLVTAVALRRIVWEIRTLRTRLFPARHAKTSPTPLLPSPPK